MPESKRTRRYKLKPKNRPGRDEAQATKATRIGNDILLELFGKGAWITQGAKQICRYCLGSEHASDCEVFQLERWAEAKGIT